MNDYLQVMGPIVRRNNGFIDKYIGDAIMALFDSADDAMVASVEMLKALEVYNIEHMKTHSKHSVSAWVCTRGMSGSEPLGKVAAWMAP